MRKAKDLINMAIVHQQTGQALAYARDLVFTTDGRRLAAIVVDSGGLFHDARVIPWSAVVSIGDVIMVTGDPIVKAKDAPELADILRQGIKLSGTPIVTQGGERIGTIGDVYVNDNGDVAGYEVSQGFLANLGGRKLLPIGNVSSVGRDAVIASSAELVASPEGLERAAQPPLASATAEAGLPSQPAPVETPDPALDPQVRSTTPRDPLG